MKILERKDNEEKDGERVEEEKEVKLLRRSRRRMKERKKVSVGTGKSTMTMSKNLSCSLYSAFWGLQFCFIQIMHPNNHGIPIMHCDWM